jgi:hypothetical protein
MYKVYKEHANLLKPIIFHCMATSLHTCSHASKANTSTCIQQYVTVFGLRSVTYCFRMTVVVGSVFDFGYIFFILAVYCLAKLHP